MDGRNFYKELMAINVLRAYEQYKDSGEWRAANVVKKKKSSGEWRKDNAQCSM